MKSFWPIFLLIIIMCTILFLYFMYFNNGFSNNINDWSGFGSYFSGTLAPLLTIANIYVFIQMTNVISNEDGKRKKNELNYQKKLIIMQLRQSELKELESVLNKALVLNMDSSQSKMIAPIIFASNYIEAFINHKKPLFPILKEQVFLNKITQLHSLFGEYNENVGRFFSYTQTPFDIDLTIQLLNLKNEIMTKLQNFIIEEVDSEI